MAGSKALTATSGPGISLYSENIGLALIGETPMVIVDVQRQGPSTGSATKGAEGDIQFIRWGTSGGLPIIALSPTTVGEAYELTYRAFNFAEKFRTPVFILTSKEIGLTRESTDLEAIELPERVDRKLIATESECYLPHAFDAPEDVPPFAPFGGDHITRYTTSTHDQAAYLTTDPETTQKMIDHYTSKIEAAADELTLVKEDFEDGAEVLVLSYGVISRSASVAVDEARRAGRKVSSIVIQSLWPVPEKRIRAAMAGIRKVVVPEMNMGQYRREIERIAGAGVEVVGVNKMDTTLVSPKDILTKGGLL
jgi:2-oxoglutarate ferredoxin oxidoreductase subunit alpha